MLEVVQGALETARSSAMMAQRNELVGELNSSGVLGLLLP